MSNDSMTQYIQLIKYFCETIKTVMILLFFIYVLDFFLLSQNLLCFKNFSGPNI